MKKSTRRFVSSIIPAIICMVMLSGCGGQALKPFAGRNLKKSESARMAILPFDNLSKVTGASKSIENIMLIEFLKHAPVTIVDPGEVSGALSQERVRLATSIPKESVKNLGKSLAVDLLMVGIVHEFEAGGNPSLALSVRIIDAANGEIVWASTATRRGNDRETIFGIGKVTSLNTLTEQTAGDLAKSFTKSLQEAPAAAPPRQ